MEATLRRQEARLTTYLRWRGYAGLLLLSAGTLGLVLPLILLGLAFDLLQPPSGVAIFLPAWTRSGFGLASALFILAVMSGIMIRAGLAWWRQRKPEAPDEGCAIC